MQGTPQTRLERNWGEYESLYDIFSDLLAVHAEELAFERCTPETYLAVLVPQHESFHTLAHSQPPA